MEKCIIVAIADNYAIGRNNDMPWHISEDLKYFRRTTTGSPVIMGFKTFLSLGSRPLPKRENIIISTHAWPEELKSLADENKVILAGNLAEAYSLAQKGSMAESPAMFVMGGGETYRKALPDADKLYITHVHAVIEDADTFFPVIDKGIWKEESRSEDFSDPATGYTFHFSVYTRR